MKIVSSLSQELRLRDCILNVIKYHIPTVMIPASQKSIGMNSHFVNLLSIASGHPIENICGNYLNVVFCVSRSFFFFGLLKAIFVKANTVEPVRNAQLKS